MVKPALFKMEGETRIEDVSWLCSLSESEIDMLISLKLLILQRAKTIGYDKLAKKFDLKMLRAIALVLMEHLKAQVNGSSLIPDLVKSAAFLDACNLLKCDRECVMSVEELSTNIGAGLERLGRRPRASGKKVERKNQRYRC